MCCAHIEYLEKETSKPYSIHHLSTQSTHNKGIVSYCDSAKWNGITPRFRLDVKGLETRAVARSWAWFCGSFAGLLWFVTPAGEFLAAAERISSLRDSYSRAHLKMLCFLERFSEIFTGPPPSAWPPSFIFLLSRAIMSLARVKKASSTFMLVLALVSKNLIP